MPKAAVYSSAYEMHQHLFNYLTDHCFTMDDYGPPECNTRQQFVWYLKALRKEAVVHAEYLLRHGTDFAIPCVTGIWDYDPNGGSELIEVLLYE